jgi:hypothetical protein
VHPRDGHVAAPLDLYTCARWLIQRKKHMVIAASQILLTFALLIGYSIDTIASKSE